MTKLANHVHLAFPCMQDSPHLSWISIINRVVFLRGANTVQWMLSTAICSDCQMLPLKCTKGIGDRSPGSIAPRPEGNPLMQLTLSWCCQQQITQATNFMDFTWATKPTHKQEMNWMALWHRVNMMAICGKMLGHTDLTSELEPNPGLAMTFRATWPMDR